jgi:hypothetical protein
MKTDYDPFSLENLARVRAKQQTRSSVHTDEEGIQKNGQKPPAKKPESRKGPEIEFLKLDLIPLRKLAHTNARGIAWAMFCALSEAWFTTGIGTRHLNPFPLSAVETKKWGLNRSQKFLALRFLTKNRFIEIDRSDPKTPLATLLWVPREP